MQLHQTLSIAMLSLLLFACGGSLDGTTTEPVVDDETPTEEDTIIEDAAPADPGVPSYFTYSGASQSWVAIQGTGGVGRTEASVLTFKLLDLNGDAVSGVDVNFALTAPSGTTLEPLTGTTDDSGFVSTTVSSGKVSGTLRVTIETADGSIELVSDILSVSTGLPDQDSFSLSIGDHSPESLNINGVRVPAVIHLADRFNNAVPDGTAVYFTTEGGAIRDATTGTVGSCLTLGSECQLEWVSQNPRPDGNKLTDFTTGCAAFAFDPWGYGVGPCINPLGMGRPYGGRVTITAFAVGEEVFIDNDADGWFSDGDDFLASQDDLSEVFFDHNEDGFYKEEQSAVNINDEREEYHDFAPINGVFDQANGIYNGTLCSDETLAVDGCTRDLINVRAEQQLIMASKDQFIRVQNGGVDINAVDLTTNGSETLKVYFADIYNNHPPTGTTITVSTDNGLLSGKTSWEVGSSAGYGAFDIEINIINETEPNKKTNGKLVIELATPGSGTLSFIMNVTDAG